MHQDHDLSAAQGAHPRDGRRGQVGGASRRVAEAGGRAVHASRRAARTTLRGVRRATTAQGAGESGLFRLIELGAVNAAGDVALAISLAGTLFFASPGQARGQVAMFLGLTMLPFAIVAPLIGPFLDRFRHGRRWAIGATMAVRAFLCWVLAGEVASGSPWLFPAALGALVASKAYNVVRAAAVPRLMPPTLTLVKANSRSSLAGVAGAALSAPIAAGAATLGSSWSLRYAFLVFVIGTVLAIRLPSRVDSSADESDPEPERAGVIARRLRYGIAGVVVTGLRSNAGLRVLSGFLTMYMAFLLRDHPFPGWEHRQTILLSLVVGAAGFGNALGNGVGSLLRSRRPENIVLATLVIDAAVTVVAAVFYDLFTAVLLGLTAGLCQQLGKLSLDSLIQRDIPDAVRASVFARSETLLQLMWVIGGFLGIALPLIPRLGLGVAAGLLVVWAVVVLRADRARAGRSAAA